MSGKLDKSLDEILVNRRQGARRGGGSRRGAKPTAAAPAAGGIRKAKATKATAKGGAKAATGPIQTEGKILVSGLVSFFFSHFASQICMLQGLRADLS